MQNIITQKDYEKFWKNGYLHIKNVFMPSEVSAFRNFIDSIHNSNIDNIGSENELLGYDVLSDFVTDKRVASIANKLLSNDVVYFGDSGYKGRGSGSAILPGKWHKDNVDRDQFDGEDWANPHYPIIRFGLFLQDHSKQGGGLMVRKKSHLKVSKKRKNEIIKEEITSVLNFRNKHIRTEIGDLLVWSLKTSHCPLGRYIKGLPSVVISQRLSQKLPNFIQNYGKTWRRYLVTSTFGSTGRDLERYLKYLCEKDYYFSSWGKKKIKIELVEKLSQNNISIYT